MDQLEINTLAPKLLRFYEALDKGTSFSEIAHIQKQDIPAFLRDIYLELIGK